jgi:hypothetical protein
MFHEIGHRAQFLHLKAFLRTNSPTYYTKEYKKQDEKNYRTKPVFKKHLTWMGCLTDKVIRFFYLDLIKLTPHCRKNECKTVL